MLSGRTKELSHVWKHVHAAQAVPHMQAAMRVQCAGLSSLYRIKTAVRYRANSSCWIPSTPKQGHGCACAEWLMKQSSSTSNCKVSRDTRTLQPMYFTCFGQTSKQANATCLPRLAAEGLQQMCMDAFCLQLPGCLYTRTGLPDMLHEYKIDNICKTLFALSSRSTPAHYR